jgi:hypothetical protein
LCFHISISPNDEFLLCDIVFHGYAPVFAGFSDYTRINGSLNGNYAACKY